MAYIREKIKKGNPYYYVVEGRRENGRVRQVILEYIGTLDKLKSLALTGYMSRENNAKEKENATQGEQELADVCFKSYNHGAAIGMLWTIEQLGIDQILTEAFSSKMIKGQTRSRVLILAIIQSAVDPGSKREFAGWCKNTSLPYHLQFEAKDLDSAAFWEAMDGISEEELNNAWTLIIKRILELYQVDLRQFHMDYSNYFTFINTANGRCTICKRGHNKQKRDDLLQFSLAALTTSILNVPISWHLYEGNVNDKAEFPKFTGYIHKQLCELGIDPSEVTVCFDGGGNSEENFSDLKFHFVCAHSMVGHKYLYDIELSKYETVVLNNGSERKAFFISSIDFSGIHGTGVLVYSEALKEGQIAQLDRDIRSIREAVNNVKERLQNKKSSLYTQLRRREKEIQHNRRDAQEYNNSIDEEEKRRLETGTKRRGRRKKYKPVPEWVPDTEMLEIISKAIYHKHTYLKDFSTLTISKAEDGLYDIKMEIDDLAKNEYISKYYGKKLICTDHTNWSVQDILNDYTDQECIENGIFRVSKDVDHFAIRPQYHWTDDKIRVHVFICLTAITVAEVLRRHFDCCGISLPKAALLDDLNEIRDGWIFVGEKKVKRVIEKMDDRHLQMWKVLTSLKESIRTTKEAQNPQMGTT